MPALRFKPQPRIANLSLETFNKYRPTLALWGVAGAGGVALFLSTVPIFKQDVLKKIPIVNEYFTDRTPDSDKPF